MARIEKREMIQMRIRTLYTAVSDRTTLPRGCDGKSPPAYRTNGIYSTFSAEFAGEVVSNVPKLLWQRTRSDVVDGDGINPTPYSCDVIESIPGHYASEYYTMARTTGYNCGVPFDYSITYCRERISMPLYRGNLIGAILVNDWNPLAVDNRVASTLYNDLVGKLYKHRNDRSGNFGVSLAESKQTAQWLELKSFKMLRRIGMVTALCTPRTSGRDLLRQKLGLKAGNNAIRDYGAYINLIKNDNGLDRLTKERLIDRARKARKRFGYNSEMFANLYLEYRYALCPLIGDIEDAMKYLVYKRPSFEFGINVSSAKYDISTEGHVPIGAGGIKVWKTEGSVQGSMSVTLKVTNPLRFTLADAGLDISSLPSIAWELLPFSWMVDWSLNLGKYLESLSAFTGCTFVRGHYSYKLSANTRVTEQSPPIVGVGTKYAASYGGKQMNARRFVLTGIPDPIWEIENPFGLKRLGDCLALVETLRRSRQKGEITNLTNLRG